MSRFQSEEGPGYTWEQEYEKTWEGLGVGEDGSYQEALLREHLLQKRRRLNARPEKVRRGMMRQLFVIIDQSACMDEADLKPTRLDLVKTHVERFVHEYFDQNPISQLGIIGTKNGRADRISDLSGNMGQHIDSLREHVSLKTLGGQPSIQNSIELARQILRGLPPHASREVVMLLGSLTSSDPGNIFKTIEECKNDNVMVSIIGLAAGVKVCETISKATNGTYRVVLDELHFRDLLMAHITPPPVAPTMETALMPVAFPRRESLQSIGPCACHDGKVSGGGYLCARCGFKYCNVPVECRVCGLMLVAAPHIARSYCHLFPPPPFTPIGTDEDGARRLDPSMALPECCMACNEPLSNKGGISQCPRCHGYYCIDCDLFIHETLNTCPGCCLLPSQVPTEQNSNMET